MTNSPPPTSVRETWGDALKGILILLVVLWHVIMKSYLEIDWQLGYPIPGVWGLLGDAVWLFLMPLFLLLSGYFAAKALTRPWAVVFRTRVVHFFYLYLLWSLIHMAAMWAFPDFPTLVPRSVGQFVEFVTISPPNTWYLYALALYFLVAKALARVPRLAVIGGALVLSVVVSAGFIEIVSNRGSLMYNFLFFLIGIHFAPQIRRFVSGMTLPRLLLVLAVYVAAFAAMRLTGTETFPGVWPVVSLIGVTMGLAAGPTLARLPLVGRTLTYLGQRSLPIYLIHMPLLALADFLLADWLSDARIAVQLVAAVALPVVLTAVLVVLCLLFDRLMRRDGLTWLFDLPSFGRRRSAVAAAPAAPTTPKAPSARAGSTASAASAAGTMPNGEAGQPAQAAPSVSPASPEPAAQAALAAHEAAQATGTATRRPVPWRAASVVLVLVVCGLVAARATAIPGCGVDTPSQAAHQDGVVSIGAAGDLLIHDVGHGVQADGGANYFSAVRPWFTQDLVTANLEQVISDDTGFDKCNGLDDCLAFRSDPSTAPYFAGFDLLNMANNHTSDFGAEGYANTRENLAENGIRAVGQRDEIACTTIGDTTVAVIGFAPYQGTNRVTDLRHVKKLVSAAAASADIVIVHGHMGAEGPDANVVTPGPEKMFGENRGDVVAFSHAAIDAGADLIVGHGPHSLRGAEFYKGRLIAYSLGNFGGGGVFGAEQETRYGAYLDLVLRPDGSFDSGRIRSVDFDYEGGRPMPDPSGKAASLMDEFGQRDFPGTAPTIAADGTITPPKSAP